MMKYVTPKIRPYHFITDIETANSAIVRRYSEDATLIEKINTTETDIHTRVESIRDIIGFSSGE